MTKKRVPPFSPEVRTRAVRMILDHQEEHGSQLAAIQSIASKIGCSGETLRNWVRQAELSQLKTLLLPDHRLLRIMRGFIKPGESAGKIAAIMNSRHPRFSAKRDRRAAWTCPALMALAHFVWFQIARRSRRRSKSRFPRPYIDRLRSFSLFTWPST